MLNRGAKNGYLHFGARNQPLARKVPEIAGGLNRSRGRGGVQHKLTVLHFADFGHVNDYFERSTTLAFMQLPWFLC